jgi:hypothetical protein
MRSDEAPSYSHVLFSTICKFIGFNVIHKSRHFRPILDLTEHSPI